MISSQGFFVPGDLPGGIYSFEANGNISALILASILNAIPESTNCLPSPQIECQDCTISINDYRIARNAVNNWCNVGSQISSISNVLTSF